MQVRVLPSALGTGTSSSLKTAQPMASLQGVRFLLVDDNEKALGPTFA